MRAGAAGTTPARRIWCASTSGRPAFISRLANRELHPTGEAHGPDIALLWRRECGDVRRRSPAAAFSHRRPRLTGAGAELGFPFSRVKRTRPKSPRWSHGRVSTGSRWIRMPTCNRISLRCSAMRRNIVSSGSGDPGNAGP
jgi:hypothetical protein